MQRPVNPYQAPASHVDDVTESGAIELAARGTRLRAFVIDGLLGVIAGGLTGFGAAALSDQATGAAILLGAGILLLIVLVIANLVLLYTRGQTIGKRVLGIRIVRPDGERAGFARLFFLRYLIPGAIQGIDYVGGVFFLVDSLFIFREPRRCIHDYLADTIVIKA
ncbi:MAG: RDD family protein [Betaproteobacteria bacterium]|nr:RDD family protein [Betaproteobacteria bacterium]